ncbi:MAG TPA: hypothetical protein VJA85_03595 [Candidatus Limnocylindria bacterium]|nr:hypothetical protein [Candidatus Limnocylindria bacterium]
MPSTPAEPVRATPRTAAEADATPASGRPVAHFGETPMAEI